jgi:hypothetical protein
MFQFSSSRFNGADINYRQGLHLASTTNMLNSDINLAKNIIMRFNLFSVALTELAEIMDNASIQRVEGDETFDEQGIGEGRLLAGVHQYENQQVFEAVLNDDMIEKDEGDKY